MVDPKTVFPNSENGEGFEIKQLTVIAKKIATERKDQSTYHPFNTLRAECDNRLHQNKDDAKTAAALNCLNAIGAIEESLSQNPPIMDMFVKFIQCAVFSDGAQKFLDAYSKGESEEIVSVAQKTLDKMQLAIDTPVETFDFGEQLDQMFIFPKEFSTNQIRTLPFGEHNLDQFLGNGFEEQTLNLFVSYPNGGKSTMAHHIVAQCIKHRIHVNLTCVEDRPKSAVSKLLACLTGLLRSEINYENKPQDVIKKIREQQELLKEYLVLDFIYGRSIDEIHKVKIERDRKRHEEGKPRLIVDIVDYTGHLAGMVRGDSKMFEKMREAYAKRKNFALMHNKIAFDFAQINREGAQKMLNNSKNSGLITMTDLAGSFDLTQVADNIISINRSLSNRSDRECKLHVCKGRDGPAGITAECTTEFERGRFVFTNSKLVGDQDKQPAPLLQDNVIPIA
jgi:KaiC/GvpD/RAD55 family RecA-like ATPase